MGILGSLLMACAGERPHNLGVRDGALAHCPSSPNCVSSHAEDERHRIEPFAFNDDSLSAFYRLGRVLAQRGDTFLVEQSGRKKAGQLNSNFSASSFPQAATGPYR